MEKNTQNEKLYRRKSFSRSGRTCREGALPTAFERRLRKNFSWISDVKTKKRNRLKKESIEAVLVTKLRLRTKDTVCYKYLPTDNQIKLHNSENLYVATLPTGQEVESDSEDEEDF